MPLLYVQVRAAHRRKALAVVGLPFGQVSIDRKATAVGAWDERYAQRQVHSSGSGASGIARTLTAALVSGRATVCLDAAPIPPATNEMGHFQTALRQLMAAYGTLDLFQVISGDAGLCSEANARAVKRHGLDYLFGLKDPASPDSAGLRARRWRSDIAAQAPLRGAPLLHPGAPFGASQAPGRHGTRSAAPWPRDLGSLLGPSPRPLDGGRRGL